MGISCNYLIYNFPLFSQFPCEQRFLSRMAFCVYEVARVACQLNRRFVYTLGDCLPNDSINAKSHARTKPLLTRYWTVQVTLTSSSSVFLLMRRGGGELPNNDTAPTGSWNATQSQSKSVVETWKVACKQAPKLINRGFTVFSHGIKYVVLFLGQSIKVFKWNL